MSHGGLRSIGLFSPSRFVVSRRDFSYLDSRLQRGNVTILYLSFTYKYFKLFSFLQICVKKFYNNNKSPVALVCSWNV